MLSLKIMILTDHRSHIEVDSFYDLVNAIYIENFFKTVSIASRGIKENHVFFNEAYTGTLYAEHIKQKINFGHTWNKNLVSINFSDYDVVLLRIDQPVSEIFLENLKKYNSNTIFINDPIGMIKTNSKEFLLKLSEFVPNISIVKDYETIKKISLNKEIVIKPIKSYGGKGISRIYKDEVYIENDMVTLEEFKEHINSLIFSDKKVLIMDYLKNINQGDKRIIVVNGKILGALLRIPPKDKWISNASMGAKVIPCEIELEELDIIKNINPVLTENGVLIYGIDTIVDNSGKRILSEINTANVGGFSMLESLYQKPVFSILVNQIIEYSVKLKNIDIS